MDVYIYALSDPETSVVCYVGKSKNPFRRYRCHINDKDETHKARWIRSLLARNLKPVVLILATVDESEWESAERRWIAHYRKINPNLTNHTEGGEGVHNPDEFARRKLSSTRREMFRDGTFKEKMLMVARDPLRRKRVSDGLIGKKHSPEHISKLPQNRAGCKRSESARLKISEALRGNQFAKGHHPSAETRKKMADSLIGNRHTAGRIMPEWEKEQRSRSNLGIPKSPEHKEKIRLAALRRWAKERGEL